MCPAEVPPRGKGGQVQKGDRYNIPSTASELMRSPGSSSVFAEGTGRAAETATGAATLRSPARRTIVPYVDCLMRLSRAPIGRTPPTTLDETAMSPRLRSGVEAVVAPGGARAIHRQTVSRGCLPATAQGASYGPRLVLSGSRRREPSVRSGYRPSPPRSRRWMPRPVTLKVDSNRLDPAGEASPYDEVMAEAERSWGALPRCRLGEKGDRYNISAAILYLSPFCRLSGA